MNGKNLRDAPEAAVPHTVARPPGRARIVGAKLSSFRSDRGTRDLIKQAIRLVWPAAAALSAGLLLPAGAATAQEAQPKAFTLSGSAALVSDYRFRGSSFSDLGPAAQASLTLTHKSGFYLSGWGSSISDADGSTAEIDIIGGWSGFLGPLSTSAGIIAYFYPGGEDTDIVEVFGTAGASVGPVNLTFGLNWAPDQANLNGSSRYLYGTASASIPDTPLTLSASLGNEAGSLVADRGAQIRHKWDWLVGASMTFSPITIGIAYVGDNLPRDEIDFGAGIVRANRQGKGGVVLSLSASF